MLTSPMILRHSCHHYKLHFFVSCLIDQPDLMTFDSSNECSMVWVNSSYEVTEVWVSMLHMKTSTSKSKWWRIKELTLIQMIESLTLASFKFFDMPTMVVIFRSCLESRIRWTISRTLCRPMSFLLS